MRCFYVTASLVHARPRDGQALALNLRRFYGRDAATSLDGTDNREELADGPDILHAPTLYRKLHLIERPMRTVVRHQPRPTRSSHIRHELRQLSNNPSVGRVFVGEQQYRCV